VQICFRSQREVEIPHQSTPPEYLPLGSFHCRLGGKGFDISAPPKLPPPPPSFLLEPLAWQKAQEPLKGRPLKLDVPPHSWGPVPVLLLAVGGTAHCFPLLPFPVGDPGVMKPPQRKLRQGPCIHQRENALHWYVLCRRRKASTGNQQHRHTAPFRNSPTRLPPC
jgi:hypothetical protein